MAVFSIRLLEGCSLEREWRLAKGKSQGVWPIAGTPLRGVHAIFENASRMERGRGTGLLAKRDLG